jgi:CheY-like chemotaxis protein
VILHKLACARRLEGMSPLAAVLCHDVNALKILKTTLHSVGMEQAICRSQKHAMELVFEGRCTALIADFDLPEAADAIKTASMLEPPQKPVLLAIAGAGPRGGEAFQSGASRILYKPLQPDQVRDAFATCRAAKRTKRARPPRYEMKCLAYLELEGGSVPAVGLNLSEQGMAIRASERIATLSNLRFRCILPGTRYELHGQADVIWTDEEGRAGMLFSRLSLSAQKHLKQWVAKRGKVHAAPMRTLLPTTDAVVFAGPREEPPA